MAKIAMILEPPRPQTKPKYKSIHAYPYALFHVEFVGSAAWKRDYKKYKCKAFRRYEFAHVARAENIVDKLKYRFLRSRLNENNNRNEDW